MNAIEADTKEILLRIEALLAGLLRASTSEKLHEIRLDDTLRKIYGLTDVGGTITQIAKASKVSTGKISGIWKSWEESGLLVREGKSYRKLVP
jgi:hypothetical protein